MNSKIVVFALISLCQYALAAQIPVHSSHQLMEAMKNAAAGDTILVSPGEYIGDLSLSGDPGNLPNGTGYFWVGNSGTPQHPIVIAALDPKQPPILKGSTLTSGYAIHITGDHIVLKSLKITHADKGVIFDNAAFALLEDCEVFNVGSELIHVRDGSNHITINRNKIYSSGNTGNGSIGEGIYVGTDQARWGADDVPESSWGAEAIAEGYGGYDWRVHDTQVSCNYISGGISAECLDIKEGTQRTIVTDNVLVGDSIGLKPGAQSYDDSFIDLKGVSAVIQQNTFYTVSNNITKFVAEVRRRFDHVPSDLTPANYSDPWCDENSEDANQCYANENTVTTTPPSDPRQNCGPMFDLDWSQLQQSTTATRSSRLISPVLQENHSYDLLGRFQ